MKAVQRRGSTYNPANSATFEALAVLIKLGFISCQVAIAKEDDEKAILENKRLKELKASAKAERLKKARGAI